MGKRVRKILLKNLLSNECICERIKEFDQSIYEDVYEQGLIIVKKIVENEREKFRYQTYQRDTEIKNVISFIGRRGTGKSSSMISFYEALLHKDDDRYQAEKNRIQKELGEDVAFIGIDCIDASRLEEVEDIFILVLASMLNKMMEFHDNHKLEEYEIRTIYQKFDKIFDDFITLKQEDSCWDNAYSSFEKLKNIASSQKIREQFSELVEEYLKIMMKDKVRSQMRFLVIAIDDIDIRKRDRHGQAKNRGVYDTLQSIYQYLSVPRVIILAAYNHEYLYRQCVEYFSDIDSRRSSLNNYITKNNINEKMASQYMEKILPVEARLYMPSWRKRDYENMILRVIDISNLDKCLKGFSQKDEKYLSVKQFILVLLAEKAGIYYDCEGKKRHFFEPDTIRSLSNKVLILFYLKDFGSLLGDTFDIETYQWNLKRLKDDLFFRYVNEKLVKVKEKNLFDEWLSQSIERRGKSIIDEIRSHSSYKALGKRDKGKKVSSTYSYAELVHAIYHMTRDDQNPPNTYSKELVACILASFTLNLSGIYWEYQYEKRKIKKDDYIMYVKKDKNKFLELDEEELDEEKKGSLELIQKNYVLLLQIIGDTFCGHWADYFFPEIKVLESRPNILKSSSSIIIVSYVEKADVHYKFEILLENEDLRRLEERQDEIEEKIRRSIEKLIFVCMFQKDFLCTRKEDVINTANDSLRVDIIFRGDLEFTGFLRHTFAYVQFFNKLEELLLSVLDNKEERINLNENVLQFYRDLLRKILNEILEEYWNWDMTYGNAMIPFYSLDLSYNLIKHIFQECQEEQMDCLILNLERGKPEGTVKESLENKGESSGRRGNRKKTKKFLEEFQKMMDRFRKQRVK